MTGVSRRWLHWRRLRSASVARGARVVKLSGQAARRSLISIYHSNDLTHAAAIAYYALLSLFPFLLLLAGVLGQITSRAEARQTTLNFVLRYFPTRIEFVARQLQDLQHSQVPLSIVGGLALTWAALGFFSAISTAVNSAWKVEQPRSYVKHKFVAFLMMVTAGSLLVLTVFLFSAAQVVGASWFGEIVTRFPGLLALRGFGVRWAATVSLIVAVGLILYFVPNAKVRFRDVWVGAILTGLLWRAAFAGFSLWLRDTSRMSIHGSIGAVILFLVWVYTSSVILLYGVEFTAAYSRLRRKRSIEAPAAPPLT
jgi:membrane protein